MICCCPKSRHKGHPAYLFRRWIFHEVLPEIRQTGKYENQKMIAEIAQLNCDMIDLKIKVGITKLSAWKIVCDTFNVNYEKSTKSKHFWKIWGKMKTNGLIAKNFAKNEVWHFTSMGNKKKALAFIRENVKHNTLSRMWQ